MKYALYDILLHLFVIMLFPYFLLKMITAKKYRTGIPERFGFIKKEKLKRLEGKKTVWVHAVSVGETKAVIPVLKLLKESYPQLKIVFSTVTRTGNKTAEKDCAGLIDALIYFPLDFSWAVKRVVKAINPRAFIVVEKEVWPNTFRALNRNSVPIIVANGTISERSFRRFVAWKFFFRDVFGMIDCYCARTGGDCDRALKAGVKKERARITGNIKFDLKPPLVEAGYLVSLQNALDTGRHKNILVAGSTHPGEEELILKAYKELLVDIKGLKLILAPRHPERFGEVEALLKKSGMPYSRRSDGDGKDIVLLDTVGELMMVYSFATVAIVGGSLVPGVGGHNLLEPAFFGKPVVYGPHLTTYLNMAEMLEEAEGGLRVNENNIAGSLKALFADGEFRKRTGEGAKRVVESNRGAAKRTVDAVDEFLSEKKRARRTLTLVK